MELEISHDAFSGRYSDFQDFRGVIARAMGGSAPPHEPGDVDCDGRPKNPELFYWGDECRPEDHPGLSIFFLHSDYDGEISPEDCTKLADEIDPLLEKINEADLGDASRYIKEQGGFHRVALKFQFGLRRAALCNEPLRFR